MTDTPSVADPVPATDSSSPGDGDSPGFASDALNVGRGFLMGGADIIPGVSGGTVALIVGIYERLVTAISRFDIELLNRVRRREWTAAARQVDLRFLITLGLGVAIGIGGLASLMHHLLKEHPEPTYAAFFGLIVASSVLVGRMVARWSVLEGTLLVSGAGFAFWLVGLMPAEPPAGYGYVFLCGMIGICAMILPGISGAFILLILGKYEDITGLIKNAIRGDVSVPALVTIAVFGTGCVVGLIGFSKLLRWLLARHESRTMAVLCGFMAGSLRKIWPFKEKVELPGVNQEKFDFGRNVFPVIDGDFWTCLGIAALAAGAVFLLDAVTKTHEQVPPLAEEAES